MCSESADDDARAVPPVIAGHEVALGVLDFLDVPASELVRVAARTGFDSVALRVSGSRGPVAADLRADPAGVVRTVQELADSDVSVLDVEVLRLASTTPPDEAARALDLAALLGARHLLAVNTDLPPDRCIEEFARVCALATGSGVRVCLEFMAFSATRDLASAMSIVETAGHPVGAVLVDALHLYRSGGSLADVMAASSKPGQRIPYVQVCGIPAGSPGPSQDDLLREAVEARLLPGDGIEDLPGFVSAVGTVPLSVEAPVAGDRQRSPEARARAAFAGLARALARPDMVDDSRPAPVI